MNDVEYGFAFDGTPIATVTLDLTDDNWEANLDEMLNSLELNDD